MRREGLGILLWFVQVGLLLISVMGAGTPWPILAYFAGIVFAGAQVCWWPRMGKR